VHPAPTLCHCGQPCTGPETNALPRRQPLVQQSRRITTLCHTDNLSSYVQNITTYKPLTRQRRVQQRSNDAQAMSQFHSADMYANVFIDEDYNDMVMSIDNRICSPKAYQRSISYDVSPSCGLLPGSEVKLYGELLIGYFDDPRRSGVDSKDLEFQKKQFQKLSIELQKWLENHDRMVESWKERERSMTPPLPPRPSTTPVSIKRLFHDIKEKHRKSCIQSSSTIEAAISLVVQEPDRPSTPAAVIAIVSKPSLRKSLPRTSIDQSKSWCTMTKSVSYRNIDTIIFSVRQPQLYMYFRPAPFIRPPPAPGENFGWLFGSLCEIPCEMKSLEDFG
jgi:hypothetical protein